MVDDLLAWAESLPAGWAWLWVSLAAAAEYVAPPLPGDTLVLFAVFLGARAGQSPAVVYVSATLGAVAGSLAAWGFGRLLGRDPARWPAFLREPSRRARIEALRTRYAERAGLWLLVNRFLPAFRAFFFVAAGVARVPAWKVVVFGGLSSAAWNGLLVVAGWTVSAEFGRLRAWSEGYARVVLGAAALAAAAWLIRRWWRGRGGPPPGSSRRSSTPPSP